MVARLLVLLLLLLPLPAAAQEVRSSLKGSWALELDGATIFRFDLEPVPDKRGEWRGTWSRPARFASDGENFAQIQLPPRQVRSMAGLEVDGSIEVSFPDPRPEAIPDIFRFRLVDFDAVEMTYVGTELEPYLLQRVPANTALGPFRDGATYSRRPPEPPKAVPPKAAPAPAPAPAPARPTAPQGPPDEADDFRLPPSGIQGR